MSQAVFAFAHVFFLSDASEVTYTLTFKAVILLFDIATALVLMAMLRFLAYSRSVVLVYWWCPLVIKEFANSGHLDSIAVFFVTASFFLLLKACFPSGTPSAQPNQKPAARTWAPFGSSLASAVLLAFGVGAKLFPLVLAPLWGVALLRRRRWAAMLPIMVFGATTLIVCWPMVARTEFVQDRLTPPEVAIAPPEPDADAPSGIEAFYRYWEMNDLLFLIVVENLKPTAQLDGQPPAWFVVSSEKWRISMHRAWQARFHIAGNEVAFVITRWLLSGVFLFVVAGVCLSVWRNATTERILAGSFLTLAWLWLLGPAQNPWYWTWAIPFLPFVRNRAWLAISGLAFLYYLRFWFEGHFAETPVLSTPYTGLRFFDFVVPWIEFGPWFLILFMMQRWKSVSSDRGNCPATYLRVASRIIGLNRERNGSDFPFDDLADSDLRGR